MKDHSSDNSYLGRVLRILESFTPSCPALSVAQLAERTGIPLPTVYRYVGELVRVGLLERVGEGDRLRASVRLWELGYRASNATAVRTVALPFMQDLHATVGHNTQLAVLDGTEVLYVERLRARGAITNITQTGERMPAKINSSGLLLAAFLDDRERVEQIIEEDISDYWLVAGPPPFAAVHVPTREEVEGVLARARRDDFCRLDAWLSPDTAGISAPIRDALGTVCAALSLIVPNDRSIPQRVVPALRTSATAISRALGWRGKVRSRHRSAPLIALVD
ncbi:IclR family transcriptional regulator [Aeromicrobium camelliae]|uniref:IclR family transcriptional regulator n=1 Tax=Aeromicrobium camelliae TaxID=1538144 RepID=A0A3N6W4A5_9ACTN|nr:IclR family transcriptional regulator [Aeromicrobium camelliae]RQN02300.1 IclR family transcriptional regulator [Aeromicrobium camelliae]